MQTIIAEEVKQKMKNEEDVVIINALSSQSFQAKHIPGSINIPAGKVKNLAKQILPDKDQTIIVHCSNKNCAASGKAAHDLVKAGYTNVYDFEAGLNGWRSAGLSLHGADA